MFILFGVKFEKLINTILSINDIKSFIAKKSLFESLLNLILLLSSLLIDKSKQRLDNYFIANNFIKKNFLTF